MIIALLGLLLLGLSFLHGPSIASALAVLLTMLGALTVLPALLSRSNDWIDRLRLPLPGREKRAANAAAGESATWARWSAFVQRNPWPSVVAALLVLLALASPALGMRLGSADAGLDPAGTTTRNAYDLIAKGFGPGINGSFLLATQLPKAGDEAAAKAVANAIAKDPGVALVTPAAAVARQADRDDRAVPEDRPAGPQDDATARAPASEHPAAGREDVRARRSTSVGRRHRRRTSPMSSPASCRCSWASSCCSARCC